MGNSHKYLLVKLSSAVQSSWSEGGTTRHNFGRGPSNDYFIKVWFQLSNWFQTRRYLCEFPIWSYVKPLWEIHIKTILSGTSNSIRTTLWWNCHWKVLFQNCVRQSRSPTKMAATVQCCLSLCPFSFGHCVVYPSLIYGFWLPLWYFHTLLTTFLINCESYFSVVNL
jgi:hypothetical protein